MALFRTQSAAVFGIEAHLIDVEVDLCASSHRHFITVGMPDTVVKESRERIKSALLNSGFGYAVRHMAEAVKYLANPDQFQPVEPSVKEAGATNRDDIPDFQDVGGQGTAKRFLEVAAQRVADRAARLG